MDVLRRLGVDLRLGLLRPLLGLGQPLLQLADAGEVLVELVAVAGAEPRLQSSWPGRGPCRGCSGRRAGGGPGPATSSGRPSRNSLANTLDGQDSVGTGAPLRVHDRLKPSHDSGRLGNRVWPRMCSAANWSSEMVFRKPARRSGCGAAGQEAVVGIVARADVRVRQAGDDGEVVAEVLEDLQVRRRARSPCPAFCGKKYGGCRPSGVLMQTMRRGGLAAAAPRTRGRTGVEPGQRQRHAGGAEEGAAVRVSSGRPRIVVESLDDSSSGSLVLEQLALHDLVHQRPQAVVLVADCLRRSPRSPARRPPRARRRWRRSAASRSGRGRAGPCPSAAVA